MYLDGRWYSLDCRSGHARKMIRTPARSTSRCCSGHVLERMLEIGDVRSDKRIDFVGGARGTAALEKAVDSGQAAVAFSMFPSRSTT